MVSLLILIYIYIYTFLLYFQETNSRRKVLDTCITEADIYIEKSRTHFELRENLNDIYNNI